MSDHIPDAGKMVPPRCEPPGHLRDVDGWHWVETQAGQVRFCRRWWKARGEWGWANMDDRTLRGFRYHSPVATPEEIEALRAEIARVSIEREVWFHDARTLRARVETMEAALHGIANWCEAYPASVFPQASADAALASCKAVGIPVDAMHGTWARHLMEGVRRDARAALEGNGHD